MLTCCWNQGFRDLNQEEHQAYWDGVAQAFRSEGRYDLWRRHSDRINCDLLANWLPRHRLERLLKTDLFDEATSGGLYPFLAQHSDKVEGVDISVEAVEAAAGKYPELKTRQADLRELPFQAGAFDCVVSNSTLDHFEDKRDIQRALDELFRVTRPGGYLLVTMDNLQNPVVWLRNHLPRSLLRKTGVVPYFVGQSLTRPGLIRYLHHAGFETLESTAILHCPRVIAVSRASAIGRKGGEVKQERFLQKLHGWERLRQWPSRYFTGYFVAVKARRPN